MPLADDEPLRDLPNRAIRQSLRHPEHLQALLQQIVPDLAAGFDCQRARLLEREFPLDDWRRREADLPFEVASGLVAAAQSSQVDVLREQEIQKMNDKLGPSFAEIHLAKGEAIGVAKGKLLAFRELLREDLVGRFGPLPDAVVQRIEGTDDLQVLRTAVRRVPQLKSLEDLPL